MRTIKFRGKDFHNKWQYGDIIMEAGGTRAIRSQEFHYVKGCHFPEESVLEDTIGQFTGLCDKNGKEIYEGDIVAATYGDDEISNVGDIQFDCGVFGAEWLDGKKNKSMVGGWGQRHNLRTFEDDLIDKIKVIGNIHDNPELLTINDKQNEKSN